MRLIIVESPAKCSKIQGFLGLGYKVIASMGHIRGLVPDLDSVGIQKNFEPTYEFSKEKARAIAQLKEMAKGAESIILCADDDREGEAIAYSVAVLLKLNPLTNPRAAFREITKNAVCDAILRPRTIDMNKVNSQQARAMLDMMVTLY
jgi:DNA topoisomerase-1